MQLLKLCVLKSGCSGESASPRICNLQNFCSDFLQADWQHDCFQTVTLRKSVHVRILHSMTASWTVAVCRLLALRPNLAGRFCPGPRDKRLHRFAHRLSLQMPQRLSTRKPRAEVAPRSGRFNSKCDRPSAGQRKAQQG